MLLAGLTLLGLGLGVLAAVFASDSDADQEAPIYYAANVLLLQRGEAQPGLQRSALLVVAGDVPTRAAQTLNRDRFEALARVATIVDPEVKTLTVSGVGASPDEALQIATTFAEELVAYILARDQEAHDAAVADAEDKIASHLAVIEALNAQVDGLRPGEGEAETGDTRAQRELLVAERSARQSSYEAALERLDVIQSDSPRPAFTTLEISQPFTISEQAYLGRLRAGRTGQANFTAPEGSLAEGGGGFTASLADNPVVLVVGGAVAGLLLGVLLIQLLSRLDYRILWKEDVEEYYGLPVIAEVPRLRRAERRSSTVVSHSEPISPVAEAYRSLRSSLVYSREVGDQAAPARDAGRRPEVVMITSAVAREGKTSTTANLAAILAEAGYSVLAVNCDFRRPQLVHYLRGDAEPCKVSESEIPGVMMINQVTPEGSEAIPSDALTAQRRVIERARGHFDVILLDTAPLLATNDANDLLNVTDLVLVVAQVGRSRKEEGRASAEVLARRDAPVVGVVLVGVPEKTSGRSYYYYSSELHTRAAGRKRRSARRDKGEATEQPGVQQGEPVPAPTAAVDRANPFAMAPAADHYEDHLDPFASAPVATAPAPESVEDHLDPFANAPESVEDHLDPFASAPVATASAPEAVEDHLDPVANGPTATVHVPAAAEDEADDHAEETEVAPPVPPASGVEEAAPPSVEAPSSGNGADPTVQATVLVDEPAPPTADPADSVGDDGAEPVLVPDTPPAEAPRPVSRRRRVRRRVPASQMVPAWQSGTGGGDPTAGEGEVREDASS